MGKRVWIRVNAKVCRDCQACVLGCSLYHEKTCDIGLARLSVRKDMARYEFKIELCRQCRDPKCLSSCPEGAMYRDERGVVIILDEKCTGCGACQRGCPFKALFYHQAANRYMKCDLCAGRETGPVCVELCRAGALRLVESETRKEEEPH